MKPVPNKHGPSIIEYFGSFASNNFMSFRFQRADQIGSMFTPIVSTPWGSHCPRFPCLVRAYQIARVGWIANAHVRLELSAFLQGWVIATPCRTSYWCKQHERWHLAQSFALLLRFRAFSSGARISVNLCDVKGTKSEAC